MLDKAIAKDQPDNRFQNSPGRAVGFALLAALLLPFVDAIVKHLVADNPVAMVAWMRMGLISLFLGSLGARSCGLAIFRPIAMKLQILRGLAAVLGTTMVFWGFRLLPLAECLAIVMIAPVIANVFSQYWLGERGSWNSWALAVISFLGVLLIAKPGSDLFTINAVFPLTGAFGLAAFLTLSRAVSAYDKPQVTAFFGPFIAFLVFSLVLPAVWVTPDSWIDIALLVGMGLLASVATYSQTLSYRYGSTHMVAPFGYSSLVVAILLGWAVFEAVPDARSMLGMLVIAVAGVLMAFSNRP